MSLLRKETPFGVYSLLCTTCLQAFTWPCSLAFLYAVQHKYLNCFLPADLQPWFSNVSAWSGTKVPTLTSAYWDVMGLGWCPQSLEHNHSLVHFSSELVIPATWIACNFLTSPVKEITCRLVIINLSLSWLSTNSEPNSQLLKLFQEELFTRAASLCCV